MQDIRAVLIKFTDTPGGCTLSELRKIQSFLSGLQKGVSKFIDGTGKEPTSDMVSTILADVELCYKNHENYKG